jgi:hypothetical protein
MFGNRRDSVRKPDRVCLAMFLLYGLANSREIIEPLHRHPRAGDRSMGAYSLRLCAEFSILHLRQVLSGFIVLLSLPAISM